MTTIRRETVAEQTTAAIRKRILDGELRPGDAVTEEAVAAELGISRSTVRQALNTLMLEGLLTRHPTKRILEVTILGADEVSDIYRARRFLELGGVEAAREKAPDGLDGVRDAVAQLREAAHGGDVESFIQADFRCHAELVELIGSRHLSAAHAALMTKLRLAIHHVTVSEQDNELSLKVHEEFVNLLTSGQFDQARLNLAERLRDAETNLKRTVAQSSIETR